MPETYTGLPPACREPDLDAGTALACAIAAAGTPEGRAELERAEAERARNRAAQAAQKTAAMAALGADLRASIDNLMSRLATGKWHTPGKCTEGMSDKYVKRFLHGVYTYDFDCNDPVQIATRIWMQDLYDLARTKITAAAAVEPLIAQRSEYVNGMLTWSAIALAALGIQPGFAPKPDDRGLTDSLSRVAQARGLLFLSPVDPRRVLQYTRLAPTGWIRGMDSGLLASEYARNVKRETVWDPPAQRKCKQVTNCTAVVFCEPGFECKNVVPFGAREIKVNGSAAYDWPAALEDTLKLPLGDQTAKIAGIKALDFVADLPGGTLDYAIIATGTTRPNASLVYEHARKLSSGGGTDVLWPRFVGAATPSGTAMVEIARRTALSIVGLEFEDTLIASFGRYIGYLKTFPPETIGFTAAELDAMYAQVRQANEDAQKAVGRAPSRAINAAVAQRNAPLLDMIYAFQDGFEEIFFAVLPRAAGASACAVVPVPFLSRSSKRRGCKIAPAEVGLEQSLTRIEGMARRVDYNRFADLVKETREDYFPPPEPESDKYLGLKIVAALAGGAALGLGVAKLVASR